MSECLKFLQFQIFTPGVYDETFRYSSYKFIKDNDSSLPSQPEISLPNQLHLPEITKEKDSPVADYLEHAATLQLPARSRAASEEGTLYCWNYYIGISLCHNFYGVIPWLATNWLYIFVNYFQTMHAMFTIIGILQWYLFGT